MTKATRLHLERMREQEIETRERYAEIRAAYESAPLDLTPRLPGTCRFLRRNRMIPLLEGRDVDEILQGAARQGCLTLPYRSTVRADALRDAWYIYCLRNRLVFVVVRARPDGYGSIHWDRDTLYDHYNRYSRDDDRTGAEALWSDLGAAYCRMELQPEIARAFRRKLRTDCCCWGGWMGGGANFPAEHPEIVAIVLQHVVPDWIGSTP